MSSIKSSASKKVRTPFKSGDHRRSLSNEKYDLVDRSKLQPMIKPPRYQLVMNVHPHTTLDLAINRAKQQL